MSLSWLNAKNKQVIFTGRSIANAPRADNDKFKKHLDDMLDVICLMLATMTSELQKQHEDMGAYEMIQNLKEIYKEQARQERCQTSKALFQCKMNEGSPVGAHVIKMMGYIQMLEKLRFPLKDELATDVILQSLPDSFKPFVLNFNMNEINKTLPQLLDMLRTAERKDALRPEKGISKEVKCFYCEKFGHWKKNCPLYLEEVKKSKANGVSSSDLENHQPNPGESHRIAIKIILNYLRRTKDAFLVYESEEELSVKVANSTTKAEYIAASEARKETVWIKKFISELRVISSISDVVELHSSHNGAIAQAKEPKSHRKSKHILMRFHLIR
ncbi:hypothetical protein V6N12_045593 [Hibiscus sabdariffa]|uniref:CCHC-type domain-containing protein n=1 Tax=Hibiscus sabdariffa TaxID=183260 RepID=A0ABR2G3P5_9ROSI